MHSIDEHFARWIDERMAESRRKAPGLGRRCIEIAGPRTRDVVQLARSAWRGWSKDLGVEDLKAETPPGYDFDSPFFRGWVVSRALPDLGIERPITWRATLGGS